MNVCLHIDRLVLDGIDLSSADRPRLQLAIEQELARLIGARGLAFRDAVALPSIRTPQITVAPDAKPSQLGTSIAGAVFGGVGGKR
ncbi:MAG TPA: hypothetical protein VHW00_06060 [Thermoanaerobaculia bacterium]|nr:hypothetical protein [Thermoanaerobaculia bacterium]